MVDWRSRERGKTIKGSYKIEGTVMEVVVL